MEHTLERVGASKEAIQHHYDVSNDFYKLWLDENMLYSCAMWGDGDTLDQAQVRKMDYMIEQARAQNAERVLDIGCGWGAVLRRLVSAHGVRQAHGLTLSEAQAAYGRQHALPGIDTRVEDWKDFAPEQPYDAIISIGAFEHFARLDFSDAEKVAAYRQFFQASRQWLKPGGYMSLQTFAYGSTVPLDVARGKESTQFLAQQIFPETDPPRLANVAEAIEGYYHLEQVRNDGLDYARTCRIWLERLRARRDEAVAIVGEETVKYYERYLQYSYLGFQNRNLALYRFTLKRVDGPLSAR
ncbi:class I SAM-dependent methyltransferase [Oxalobacteraceae bacterium]|nr:class I SAM-dependent methyltransferase [Oxalobacteraceae bacterium]